jgi:hypothetical protein
MEDLLKIASTFLQSPAGIKVLEKVKGLDLKNFKEIQEGKTEEEIEELKEEKRKELGEKYGKYIPYFGIFTTQGIVYDERTKEPIEGIQVQPQLGLFPITKEPRVNIITEEILKDVNGDILYEAKKAEGNKYVTTNKKGEWKITLGVPYLDAANRVILPQQVTPFVTFIDKSDKPHTESQRQTKTKGEYAPNIQYITTLEGEVFQDQSPIGMLNIEDASKIAAQEAIVEVTKIAAKLAEKQLDTVEQTLNALVSLVLKPATVIQTKLLPLAFQLMLYFGIAKEEQAKQKLQKCPDGLLLAEILKKRNSIVRQLNNIYAIIIANTALAALFLYLSKYLIGIKEVIANISFPVSIPPGVGVPYSLISKLEGIQDLLEEIAGINKELKKNLFIALIFLIISLILILRYMKTIDNLIKECTPNAGLEPLNKELLALQEQSAEQGEPELKIVNGFSMSVEVVDKAQVGDLPRRQAIAKNSKGIIILKGEPSFSAQDQILIDELSFYIIQNDLKAD